MSREQHANPVQWVGHRGYPARYPENTLIGVRAALTLGARYVEFDVHLTADGVPVVFHDRELLRTTGVSGLLLEMNHAQLANIFAGEPARFGERFAREPIPTLADMVTLLSEWPQATAFVELKRASLSRCGVDAMVQRVLAVIAPIAQQCVIISFDAAACAAARTQGAARIGWVAERWDAEGRAQAMALKPDYLFFDYQDLPADTTHLEGPWQWALYEISDPALARLWTARGAVLIETDAVGEMRAALVQGASA